MIYLLSTGGGKEFEDSLRNELKGRQSILFIPFAKEMTKRNQWIDVSLEQYEDIGVDIKECNMIQEDNTREEMIEKINNADIISIMGGNPLELMDKLKTYELVEHIRSFKGTIIATSAGTLALCNYCIITKDNDFDEGMYRKGFGIVDINVAVHYYSRDLEMDKNLRTFSKEIGQPIYGLDDLGNVIVFDEDEFLLLGNTELCKYNNGIKVKVSNISK